MALQHILINLFIITKQSIKNLYHYIKPVKIKSMEESCCGSPKIYSVLCKYICYTIINKLISQLDLIRNKLDITASKIEVSQYTPDNKRKFILDQEILGRPIGFSDIHSSLNSEIDNNMMNNIIIHFDLLNERTKVCLKKYLIGYKDNKEIYHNTINNILLFNQIEYTDNSKIYIRYIQGTEIKIKVHLIEDIRNKHINYLLKN